MDPLEICYQSAGQLSKLIKLGQISPVEIIEAHLERIELTEPVLNSFITLTAEQAINAAHKAESEITSGNYKGPLHGIPVGLKDLFNTGGIKTTSGSRIFDNFIPDRDCTVAARFNNAGAILLGKLNMHQFAYGPTGENPDYGHMHNPWNPDHYAGGSSGGSGSATAAGQCTVTMGSDTGGSVRIPASLCGIVGLKPTYGLLSRHGLTPLAWSMDHPGPMVRTVEDAAIVLNAISGADHNDKTTYDHPESNYTTALIENINGLKIGVVKEFFDDLIHPEVDHTVREALKKLEELGAQLIEISFPMYSESQAISSTILMSEAAAYHRELVLNQGDQLYEPVRLRLQSGLLISAADYIRAQQARTMFNQEASKLLQDVDLLVGPTEPVPAPPLLSPDVTIQGKTIGITPALTQYTRPYNITGFPAISIPCGFSEDGLPIGLQLAGKPFDEITLLRAAYTYEQSTTWHKARPNLIT